MSMKQVAEWALDTATQRGASYADARIVDDRQRTLASKNGKVGHAASGESLGIGIRVLSNDSWGFAASDDLSRESVERTAAQAVEIDWVSPCRIDPFTTSIEQNLELLTKIDSELLSVPGVTLAESNMHFGR